MTCHVRDAVRLRRPFVMSGARCACTANLFRTGRGALAPPICHVRDAVRLHRRFVTSWTRCTYVAHLSCLDAVRLHRQFVMSGTRCACARRGWAECICANCMCPAHDSNSVMQSRAHTDRNLMGVTHDIRMRLMRAVPAQAAYISTAPQQNQARRRSRRRTTPRTARLRVCPTRCRFLTAMRPAAAHVPHGIAAARVALRPCLSHGASIALFAGCALALRFGCGGGWDM